MLAVFLVVYAVAVGYARLYFGPIAGMAGVALAGPLGICLGVWIMIPFIRRIGR